ncbi:PEP-CTERM sorting domain-containing protein [Mariniblastus fucicola]|nr:PEP-CTERM sorting domain-containing protein [Mariniblastus fucicola]
MKTKTNLVLLVAILFAACDSLAAHDGKRLDIVVINNQLYAQGYLSGTDPIDDGGGIVRPYLNVVHGHLSNVGSTIANSTLPGFDLDLDNAPQLLGHDLTLSLMGAGKWDEPPRQDGTGLAQDFGTPVLSDLSVGELLSISFRIESISTDNPGSITLGSDISEDLPDLDPTYEVNLQPDNVIYFLEWELSTSNPDILASETIYTIHSPPGVGPEERLHFQSLALERHFGIQAVPEPGSVCLIALAGASLLMVRRRS